MDSWNKGGDCLFCTVIFMCTDFIFRDIIFTDDIRELINMWDISLWDTSYVSEWQQGAKREKKKCQARIM